jgi:hypothetical protein
MPTSALPADFVGKLPAFPAALRASARGLFSEKREKKLAIISGSMYNICDFCEYVEKNL